METEISKLQGDRSTSASAPLSTDLVEKLQCLIKSLGGVFYETLVSNRSERRVMTIALSNNISKDVADVITLGVENGYFYKSTIGAKEGHSRAIRYVLTRRVAPYFRLDPTGFSGYLFVTNEFLEIAVKEPKRAVDWFKAKRLQAEEDDSFDSLPLFQGVPDA